LNISERNRKSRIKRDFFNEASPNLSEGEEQPTALDFWKYYLLIGSSEISN
jgi:hypothetical protein